MHISPQLFSSKILSFYKKYGRKNLPWQKQPTAYRVWVSEIMLQQTQVKTVIPYYLKFIKSFPTVNQLASANIDQVLHHWQGLGYYSRARNLHKSAQLVSTNFHGQFPDNLEQMQSLPGIGPSTAGAVLSFAMGKPTPILDGNVKRVLARVFLVDGWYGQTAVMKKLWQLSKNYTPKKNTNHYNQAMMDLGASFCSRSKPKCELCPLKEFCLAHIHNKTNEYPHKKPKKQIPTKQAYLLLHQNDQKQIQLQKKPSKGIWGGLWSLPELETETTPAAYKTSGLIEEFRHTFTHFHLEIKILPATSKTKIKDASTKTSKIEEKLLIEWHNITQLKELAFPTPIKKFLFRHFQIHNEENSI